MSFFFGAMGLRLGTRIGSVGRAWILDVAGLSLFVVASWEVATWIDEEESVRQEIGVCRLV